MELVYCCLEILHTGMHIWKTHIVDPNKLIISLMLIFFNFNVSSEQLQLTFNKTP
jgi:hypothetical protein